MLHLLKKLCGVIAVVAKSLTRSEAIERISLRDIGEQVLELDARVIFPAGSQVNVVLGHRVVQFDFTCFH
nr:hypothetical protein [Hymenobacter sp. BT559]